MSDEEKKEAYLFYSEMNDKNEIFFNIYTECVTTHDINNKGQFMMWHPISLNKFLEIFEV
jgi:hypothetical protein